MKKWNQTVNHLFRLLWPNCCLAHALHGENIRSIVLGTKMSVAKMLTATIPQGHDLYHSHTLEPPALHGMCPFQGYETQSTLPSWTGIFLALILRHHPTLLSTPLFVTFSAVSPGSHSPAPSPLTTTSFNASALSLASPFSKPQLLLMTFNIY